MRKRDNLIALRADEGSALDKILTQQKSKGEGMKELIHSWAEAHARSLPSPIRSGG